MPYRPRDSVPECEEWLTEVGLNTPALVVDVVVCGVIARNMLKRIPWQFVPTMVVYCLNGGPGKEAHSLSW